MSRVPLLTWTERLRGSIRCQRCTTASACGRIVKVRRRGARLTIADGQLHILLSMATDGNKLQSLYDAFPCLQPPYTVEVPLHAPLTRVQFEQANALWPVSFHEDKQLTQDIRGEFSDAELEAFASCMDMAIEAARSSAGACAGAVIADSRTNTILARAADSRLAHPLQHAAMNAIAIVAEARRTTDSEENVTEASEEVDADRRTEATADDDDSAYICSGLDVFLTREPCVMCSMALLHSRVGRVFYGVDNAECGGLFSVVQLHTDRRLNHRFKVYRNVLATECAALAPS